VAARPRRGRPPRLDRDRIVEAVAAMLREDPHAPLTMARAADAVGASLMTLYRYFDDRDDLALSVARFIMRGGRAELGDGAPWQDRVRAWMTTVYEQSLRYPQLIHLSVGGRSHAWLGESAYLASILRAGGFTDDAILAEAVYWVASTTLGQALIAASLDPVSVPDPGMDTALQHLSDAEAGVVGPLLPRLAALGSSNFDRIVDLTVAALPTLLG
jgi:AcrR family transcriptional regulator